MSQGTNLHFLPLASAGAESANFASWRGVSPVVCWLWPDAARYGQVLLILQKLVKKFRFMKALAISGPIWPQHSPTQTRRQGRALPLLQPDHGRQHPTTCRNCEFIATPNRPTPTPTGHANRRSSWPIPVALSEIEPQLDNAHYVAVGELVLSRAQPALPPALPAED